MVRGLPLSAIILAQSFLLIAAADHGSNLVANIKRSHAAPVRPSLRVNVRMTLVPVSVFDPFGRNVLGLRPENFKLFDELEPQKIASFSQQDAPVSVGIVFDSSGSMFNQMQAARSAVAELFDQLNPDDEGLLVGVSESPSVAVPITSTLSKVSDAILFTAAKGSTPLIDGVYLALQRLRRAHHSRRALIVISDGQDNSSRYTEHELRGLVIESSAQIYTVGLFHSEDPMLDNGGRGFMSDLAKWTGGRCFEVQSFSELRDAMARIGITLHNEYVLGYYPPDDAPPGKYRRIRVALKAPVRDLSVSARHGYYTFE